VPTPLWRNCGGNGLPAVARFESPVPFQVWNVAAEIDF
jgi:hypothetical protein